MILHPAKQKVCYLLLGKNSFARFTLILVLKTVISIEQVHEHRHLGVVIDDEFSWRTHTLLTHVKQYQKNIYLLSQLKHFVDTPKRKLFYHAHGSPHLTYASSVWDGCGDILFNKLNSLHRRAAKFVISNCSLTTDAKLPYLGLLPLKEKLYVE